jgi:hypothetical protein
MDLKKLITDAGNSLAKAKNYTTKATIEKARNSGMSKSGTGVHSPGSFGVSAETGAPPVSARMAGGIGLQKVASSLIHTGINQYVMPELEKRMQGLAQNIKSDLQQKKHVAKGGKMMPKPSVSM